LNLADNLGGFSTLAKGHLGRDGGALARDGLDLKPTTDHLQPFPHAEQTESLSALGIQQTLCVEGFAVILYFGYSRFFMANLS
jgi:hypothetical protein